MSSRPFDLDTALATWRHFLARQGRFLDEDLDELEIHLRDEIDALMAEGLGPEEAFETARQRVGDSTTIEAAFDRIRWEKLRHEGKIKDHIARELAMLTNNLKVALRSLRRQFGYALINVGGLALGLTCVFLVVLYVQHERSFDRFHEHADDLYLLDLTNQKTPADLSGSYFAAGIGPRLEAAVPSVAHAVRFWNAGVIVRVEDEPFTLSGFYPVDAAFLQAFTFPLVRGDAATALVAPDAAVVTQEEARTLFGTEDVVGRTLRVVSLGAPLDLTITGVMQDPPTNTRFRSMTGLFNFQALATQFGRDVIVDGVGGPQNFNVYVQLEPGVDPATFSAEAAAFVQRAFQPADPNAHLALIPLTRLHLDPAGRRSLNVFSVVALLILLVACVNFMNLATSRATRRAREVGVRKALGARRGQLVRQFLGESLLLSLFGIAIALVLVPILMPAFGALIEQEIHVRLSEHLPMAAALLGIGLAAGVLAGSYPAWYLSSFRPARVMKGEPGGASRTARLRKVLIVLQFGISIFLIAGTMTIFRQIRYMKHQPLGFDRDHVVFATTSPAIRARLDAFKQQLGQNPNVMAVTAANGVPARYGSTRGYSLPERPGDILPFYTLYADVDYLDVLGIEVKAGRYFSDAIPTDAGGAVLLNETAVKRMGFDNPLGKIVIENNRQRRVIGVVDDFHFKGLTQTIGPLAIQMDPTQAWYVAVRIAPGHVPETMAFLKAQWAAFDPDRPFDGQFLDATFDRQYRQQEHQGELFTTFAFIALFIACLGLLGLAAFVAERRRKEIGIRKVLGASVPGLVALMSGAFARLVALSWLLAAPVAYYAMDRWLRAFPYRIDPSWRTFVLAGALALGIALVTISYQAIRAAVADPVKALRYE